MTRFLGAASLLCLSVGLAGQTFRTRADLVALQVTVTDRRGQPVSDLTQSEFEVFEDNVPQTVGLFVSDDRPVAVGLVVDNSISMWNKREQVMASAEAFARSSHPDDELFTVNFNEHVSFGLPADRPFTSDRVVLHEALERIQARGRTALYDGVASALDHVATSQLDGRVLIVVSDGGDNASRKTLEDVLEAAGRSSTVVHTVGVLDESSTGRDREVLRRLATATGGLALFPSKVSEIDGAFDRLARDIRHRYTIGYQPSNAKRDGTYRKVRVVAVDRATRKLLEVRTRAGYLAPR